MKDGEMSVVSAVEDVLAPLVDVPAGPRRAIIQDDRRSWIFFADLCPNARTAMLRQQPYEY